MRELPRPRAVAEGECERAGGGVDSVVYLHGPIGKTRLVSGGGSARYPRKMKDSPMTSPWHQPGRWLANAAYWDPEAISQRVTMDKPAQFMTAHCPKVTIVSVIR